MGVQRSVERMKHYLWHQKTRKVQLICIQACLYAYWQWIHTTIKRGPHSIYCALSINPFKPSSHYVCRSQWPRGLRRRSSAARLLRFWVRNPPGSWIFVCCVCCVLSGRGLCDGLITRSEESYRLWRVVVCDQETSKTRRLKPATGLRKYNHSGL